MSAMLLGAILVGGWLVGIPGAIWQWKKDSPVLKQLGMLRYGIVATLFMIMSGVLVKMVLRLTMNIKYILVIPNILNI
jgi:O-antigen ligase